MDYVDVPAPSSAYVVKAAYNGEFVDKVIAAESSGNPQARPCDPKTGKLLSSAFGAGQFIAATWLEMIKKYRLDLADKTDEEILDLRGDFELAREMLVHYTEENRMYLLKHGLKPTYAALYLAHFAGPRGTTNLLKADRDSPVADILSPEAIEANGFLEGKTVAALYAWAKAKMNTDVGPASRRVALATSSKVTPHASIPGCGSAQPAGKGADPSAEEPDTPVSSLGTKVRVILEDVVRFAIRS